MVFSTTNLFKGIPCPEGEKCTLTTCIYGHGLRPKESGRSEQTSATTTAPRDEDRLSQEPAAKRRRITYDALADKPPSKADKIREQLAATREAERDVSAQTRDFPVPSRLEKSISPPPARGKATSSPLAGVNTGRADNRNGDINKNTIDQKTQKPGLEHHEKLNPRLIPNDPAGHAKRSLFLKYLHAEMTRLNQKVAGSHDLEHKQLLLLSDYELVKKALDEEEKLARDQPVVYGNIIKNRIATYKKMTVEEWASQVRLSFQKEKRKSTPGRDAEKPIDTGLTPDEEVLILPHLIADQSKLTQFGYIPTPPTEAQAAEAAAAVEASKNYEVCDRCGARFQVFPERNEDGLLTSNGPCKHHPNKKTFPQRSKTDHYTGPKEPYYPCCNNIVGSPGCASNEYHVFKSSNPARLAAVLPFASTLENAEPARDERGRRARAVAFDCEMGYTVFGLELIRLTAVAWPSGEELVDVLVSPVGTVIDLNSRFSGVWPETFANAIPYEEWSKTPPPPPSLIIPSTTHSTLPPPPPPSLPIVSSPSKARELLCTFLTPTTPLIGHAIDNDLNAVRLCHPAIVDTIVLYPHPRGLPLRFGLKMLSQKHLGRSIQMGGSHGHDSLEDARATGDLVRVKVGERWSIMRRAGWKIVDGQLVAPLSLAAGGVDLAKAMVEKAFSGAHAAGKKRRKRRPGVDEAADGSTEDEEVPVAGIGGVGAYVRRKPHNLKFLQAGEEEDARTVSQNEDVLEKVCGGGEEDAAPVQRE